VSLPLSRKSQSSSESTHLPSKRSCAMPAPGFAPCFLVASSWSTTTTTLWYSASAQLSGHPTRSFPWPAIRGGSRSSSSMAQTYAIRTVCSKVKASKSGASDSRNPKTSTHPRSKRSLHKPFFPMSRRFLLLRAFPPSSSPCQQSSGHDARENDEQLFHRADASNLRLSCGCCSCQSFMWASTQTDLSRYCKTTRSLRPKFVETNK